MKRDIICRLRIFIDKLPRFIRESRFLFLIAKYIFKLPNELFTFREDFRKGKIKDLSILYSGESNLRLERASKNTDINSYHLKIIYSVIDSIKPKSIIDVGCGTGFLLELLDKRLSNCTLKGIDFSCPSSQKLKTNNDLNFIREDIYSSLVKLKSDSADLVICAHVLEHLSNPESLIQEIRRVTKKSLILICPLEKPYKWGMNYHVQFFKNSKNFIDFIRNDQNSSSSYSFYERIGDCLYIENKETKF